MHEKNSEIKNENEKRDKEKVTERNKKRERERRRRERKRERERERDRQTDKPCSCFFFNISQSYTPSSSKACLSNRSLNILFKYLNLKEIKNKNIKNILPVNVLLF